MTLDLTEEQLELVSMLRTILAQRSDSAAIRRAVESAEGFDARLWSFLCEEIGVASLAIPEEFGGAGFTLMESQVTLEELGYALAPSPYLGSIGIAAQAILASGDADAAERLLPAIAAGESLAALAWAAPDGRWNPGGVAIQASRGDAWTLTGSTPFVLEGAAADVLLVIARTSTGPRLFEVIDPATVTRTATPTMDLTLRVASLAFDGTLVRPLGESNGDVLETTRAFALTAVSAVQAGTASRALDMTVEYAKQRVQFGRTIGSFQAIKHRLADMHVQAEIARTTTRAAATALANGAADRLALAALAKITCSQALETIAAETIQLHGGIAITWEHDAHLIFKRAHALGELFGTARELRTEAGEPVLGA